MRIEEIPGRWDFEIIFSIRYRSIKSRILTDYIKNKILETGRMQITFIKFSLFPYKENPEQSNVRV